MEWAEKEDAVIRLEQQPGQYVIAGQPLGRIWPKDKIIDQLPKQINRAFALDDERTPSQDIEFAVLELVEIALRALSPSLNDSFTAIACINNLGSAQCRLAPRDMLKCLSGAHAKACRKNWTAGPLKSVIRLSSDFATKPRQGLD